MPRPTTILTPDALAYYWDHAYDFVCDLIIAPTARNLRGLKPTHHQKQALDEISKYNRISIESGHGCHPAGTKVIMNNGSLKKVENIKAGDLLLGDDGHCRRPRTVLRLYRGSEMIYRIRYRDGTYYDVNESHKLCLVATQTKKYCWTNGEVTEVSVRDYLRWPKGKKRVH